MSLPARDGGPDVDALLVLSFGGPEGPDDVLPFLDRVTAGRGIPRERLAEVGRHYEHVGGVSPINGQNRALVAAVRDEVAARGWDLPVYWGNRNWHPLVGDVMAQMARDGVRRALVWVTSVYSSYSGCRQYRENLADAAAAVAAAGLTPPELAKLRHCFDHPGFVAPTVEAVAAAIEDLPGPVRLVFTTHSIPVSAAVSSGPPGGPAEGAYVAQHRAVAGLVADGVAESTGRRLPWDLVYQSRSGPPQVPWLEPDVGDHVAGLPAQGVESVVLVPIGFVSDHMEVVWDLDVVAMDRARESGLHAVRVPTVGTDPRFVAMIADLVAERCGDGPTPQRAALSPWGPGPDACAAGCCPNPRGPRPACCGDD